MTVVECCCLDTVVDSSERDMRRMFCCCGSNVRLALRHFPRLIFRVSGILKSIKAIRVDDRGRFLTVPTVLDSVLHPACSVGA